MPGCENKLKLNLDRPDVLLVQRSVTCFVLFISSKWACPVHSLRVLQDPPWLIVCRMVVVTRERVFAELWLGHQLILYWSRLHPNLVVHVLLTTRLDCNMFYMGLLLKPAQKVQFVQNTVGSVWFVSQITTLVAKFILFLLPCHYPTAEKNLQLRRLRGKIGTYYIEGHQSEDHAQKEYKKVTG